MMALRGVVAALIVALTGGLAFAQTAYRVNRGIQIIPGLSRPSTDPGRRTLWVDNSNNLRFYNGSTDFTLSSLTAYSTIRDEGTPLTQRSILNFIGAGVTCVDNSGSSRTDCTISSGGSTGNWTFSSDAADLSGASVMTLGATTATGVTIGRSAGANTLAADTTIASGKKLTGAAGADLRLNAVSGQQLKLRINDADVVSVSGTAVTFAQPLSLTGTQTGTYTFGGAPSFSSDTVPSSDNALLLGDNTHRWLRFYGSSIGPATTQMHALPAVASDTIALLAASQTFTTKTYSSPIFSGSSTGTWNLGGTVTATAAIRSSVSTTYTPSWNLIASGGSCGAGTAYCNSYIDYGAPYSGSAWYVDAAGICHVRLHAKSGTNGATIVTLPSPCRPGGQLAFAARRDAIAMELLVVQQDGQVFLASGGNTQVAAEFSFPAEN